MQHRQHLNPKDHVKRRSALARSDQIENAGDQHSANGQKNRWPPRSGNRTVHLGPRRRFQQLNPRNRAETPHQRATY